MVARRENIPIINIKPYTGEGRASTSAMQVAHASMMLNNTEDIVQIATPKAISVIVDGVPLKLKQECSQELNYVLVTSFSYGGGFSAVILKKA